MSITHLVPQALGALYANLQLKRLESERQGWEDAKTPQQTDRPGINYRLDRDQAYRELVLAINAEPERFFRKGGVDEFIRSRGYPRATQNGVRNLMGKYLQSIVDIEYEQDPFSNRMPFGATQFETPALPGLQMGSAPISQTEDQIAKVGPFNYSKYTIKSSPQWDHPTAEMYLQKRAQYGTEAPERVDWMELAHQYGGEPNHSSYNEKQSRMRDAARQQQTVRNPEPGDK